MGVITGLCFGKDLYAVDVPNFQAPLDVALDNLTPAFTSFRHFTLLHNIISSMLPNMSAMMNPDVKGLVQMQVLLRESIEDHDNNPSSHDRLIHSKTIFHLLLDSKAKKES